MRQTAIAVAIGLIVLALGLLVLPRGGSVRTIGPGTVSVKATGAANTMEYKLYFHGPDGNVISPWHDIPLRSPSYPFNTWNFVCEIPKGTQPKMEINKETPHNPIIQDTKNGKLRDYPWPSRVNYGALPQTWEEPGHKEVHYTELAGLEGDNDPLDVVEMSATPCAVGEVYQVHAVGALGMVDDGEIDWKIVTVRVDTPEAQELTDASELDTLQGVQKWEEQLRALREWFRDYKKPAGKPENKFAFGDKYLGRHDAIRVIDTTHQLWSNLVSAPRSRSAELWWEQRG